MVFVFKWFLTIYCYRKIGEISFFSIIKCLLISWLLSLSAYVDKHEAFSHQ